MFAKLVVGTFCYTSQLAVIVVVEREGCELFTHLKETGPVVDVNRTSLCSTSGVTNFSEFINFSSSQTKDQEHHQ